MSSDELEVAELAKAINSHADVLYESWKTNNNAQIGLGPAHQATAAVQRPLYDIVALKRMEDTLELLADPGLTPKLEHLVSNFVKRDKAKRLGQQSSSPLSPSSRGRSSSPVKIIPIQKENGMMMMNNNQNSKKPLPKSILAAVQRFEPSSAESQQHLEPLPLVNQTAPTSGVMIPGIGSVTRDILKAESNLSNRVVEKSFRLNSPIRTTLSDNNNAYNHQPVRNGSPAPLNNYFYERQLLKTNNDNAREIRIPIERVDENGARSKITNGSFSSSDSFEQPIMRTPSRHQFTGISDLEREEEKLVHALRTGQVIKSPASAKGQYHVFSKGHGSSVEGRGISPVHIHRIERDVHDEPASTIVDIDGISSTPNNNLTSSNNIVLNGNHVNNTNPRIAFAKERIRHSQEHPLTQQRLELQKQLPSPSSSLAAAIAVQQGKIKFEPSNIQQPQHYPPHEEYHHQHHHRIEHQNSREATANGRQNWVSNMLKFGPGGSSSVAERVQLFEKYPAHVLMGNHHSHHPSSSSSSRDQNHFHHDFYTHGSGSSGSTRRSNSPRITNHQINHELPVIASQNHVYYSTPSPPVSIPLSPPSSPKEITHTIRTSPELLFSKSPDLRTSKIIDPIRTEAKIINSNKNSVQDDHRSITENPLIVPWRHNSHREASPIAQIQNHVVKPDEVSITKKYKFGGRITPTTKSSLGSEIRIGDGKQPLSLPRFYWAEGKLPPSSYVQEMISKAKHEYNKLKGTTPLVSEVEFGQFLTGLGIPLYWKKPFWLSLGPMPDNLLDFDKFLKFYHRLVSECPDDASRFIRILCTQSRMTSSSITNNNNNITDASVNGTIKNTSLRHLDFKPTVNQESEMSKLSNFEISMSDFIPMIQDIIDTHPGLGFLRDAPEFHSRYVTTVVSRIFYMVNRSWSGRITLSELRRSNVLRVIKRLEEETDVNNITEYFSYEHFYVIYCKFWELDKDHDLLIDKTDLASHSDHALSSRIVDRIFSGAVIRGWDMTSPVKCSHGKMTYSDFVWFLISEEDKKTQTAIEYWFRCLDIDGDGVLSPYELQHFYSEQERRIEHLGIEPLDFSNIYCQIIDMLRCSPNGVRLKDLKKNPQLASNIFNTLFNLDKYLDHEQRDPFSAAGSGPNLSNSIGDSGNVNSEVESDWDKYAAAEYDLLIAEESPSDVFRHDSVSDFEETPGFYAP